MTHAALHTVDVRPIKTTSLLTLGSSLKKSWLYHTNVPLLSRDLKNSLTWVVKTRCSDCSDNRRCSNNLADVNMSKHQKWNYILKYLYLRYEITEYCEYRMLNRSKILLPPIGNFTPPLDFTCNVKHSFISSKSIYMWSFNTVVLLL